MRYRGKLYQKKQVRSVLCWKLPKHRWRKRRSRRLQALHRQNRNQKNRRRVDHLQDRVHRRRLLLRVHPHPVHRCHRHHPNLFLIDFNLCYLSSLELSISHSLHLHTHARVLYAKLLPVGGFRTLRGVDHRRLVPLAMTTAWDRVDSFSGVGIGVGFGVGCAVGGIGSGMGGISMPNVRIPFFGWVG